MFFPNGLYNRFKNYDRILTEDFKLCYLPLLCFLFYCHLKVGWLNNCSNTAVGRCAEVLGWCSFLWCGLASLVTLSVKALKPTAPVSYNLSLHYIPHPCGSERLWFKSKSTKTLLVWSCSKIFVSKLSNRSKLSWEFSPNTFVNGIWMCYILKLYSKKKKIDTIVALLINYLWFRACKQNDKTFSFLSLSRLFGHVTRIHDFQCASRNLYDKL